MDLFVTSKVPFEKKGARWQWGCVEYVFSGLQLRVYLFVGETLALWVTGEVMLTFPSVFKCGTASVMQIEDNWESNSKSRRNTQVGSSELFSRLG